MTRMNNHGIAFIDDFIDNIIAFSLIAIIFLLAFLIQYTSQNAAEETYEKQLAEVHYQENLVWLLRTPITYEVNLADMIIKLEAEEDSTRRTLIEEKVTVVLNDLYGTNWNFKVRTGTNTYLLDIDPSVRGNRPLRTAASATLPKEDSGTMEVIILA